MDSIDEIEGEGNDRAYELDHSTLDDVIDIVERKDQPALLDIMLEPFHAADIADMLEQITPAKRSAFHGTMGR